MKMRIKIVYTPDEGGWLARVPSVRGCHTFGRTIGLARRNVREALATCVDVLGKNADTIARAAELVDDVRLPGRVQTLVATALRTKREADKGQRAARAQIEKAVVALTRVGLSARDAAEVVGLSHQRVHQIAHGG